MSRPVVEEEWPEFVQLKEQVISLWFELRLFEDLYSKDKQTVDILNATAREFFYSLGVSLPNNLLRILAAVYDNSKTGSNANITLDGVVAVSGTWISLTSHSKCECLLKSVSNPRGKLRDMRNKRLSHLDRRVLLGQRQLGSLTLAEILLLAKTAGKVLNEISGELFDGSTGFENPIRRAPSDIMSVLQNQLMMNKIREHVKAKTMPEETAGKILAEGLWHSRAWQEWCLANKLNPKHYLP